MDEITIISNNYSEYPLMLHILWGPSELHLTRQKMMWLNDKQVN